MSDPHHPDFAAWLAQREAEVSGDADPATTTLDYVMVPNYSVPGWQRLADLLPKIIAGAIGGGAGLALAGMALYFSRVPS